MEPVESGGRWAWVPGRRLIKRLARSARLRLYANPVRQLYERGVLDRNRLTWPQFLGIGAPKAGTTWLHHNLAAHPNLYLPDRKELHFFTGHQYRGVRWYARQFSAAGDRMPGEITPGYATLPAAEIAGIRRLLPDARLLLLVRNPVDRAWSHAVMKLARETGRAIDEVPDAEYIAHFRGEHSMQRGDYRRMISTWTSVFPSERLWVWSFDDIINNPQRLLTSAFRHLGVDEVTDWSGFPYAQVIDRGVHGGTDVFDKSPGPDIPERLRPALEDLLLPQIEQLAECWPEIAKPWLP